MHSLHKTEADCFFMKKHPYHKSVEPLAYPLTNENSGYQQFSDSSIYV